MAISSPFLNAFRIELSQFHRDRLEAIDNFDFEPALRKVSHDLGGVTDRYLREGEFALKQYYAVALLDP